MARNYKLWSEKEENKLVELYNAGYTNREITEQLNRNPDSVKHRVQLLKERKLIIGKRRTKTTKENYYHNAHRIIENFKKNKTTEISKENYNLILEVDQNNEADGLTENSRSHYVRYLSDFAKSLKKTSFLKASLSNDVETYIILKQKHLKESSFLSVKSTIKMFYRYLFEKKPTDANVLKIYNFLNKRKRSKTRKFVTDTKEHLTRQEMVKLVASIKGKSTDAIRNRALIACLYDSGARINELLATAVKDCNADEKVPKFFLPISKTEPRNSNMLNFSLPYLMDWIKTHEYWNNKEAPVFYSMSTSNYGDPITAGAVGQILRRALKISGIKKKITLHGLRHSKAYHMAEDGMLISEANKLFGWGRTSGMFHYYSSVKDKEVEFKELERANKLTPEQLEERKQERNAFVMKTCMRCKEKILPNQFVCGKCGLSIDKNIASQELDHYKTLQDQIKELQESVRFMGMRRVGYKKVVKKKLG